MQVLAVVGSPRERGNCDLLVDRLLAGCASNDNTQIEKVMINDINVLPCQGCMECRAEGKCDAQDDVAALLTKISSADVIVVAAPIYGNHIPGQFKVLFDRFVGMSHRIDSSVPGKLTSYSRLEKKQRQLILLAVAGAPRDSSCDQAISFLRRVFLPETNGGAIVEMRAIGVSAKGQVGMNEAELVQLLEKISVPDSEELVRKMLERNEKYLQQAYDIGKQVVS